MIKTHEITPAINNFYDSIYFTRYILPLFTLLFRKHLSKAVSYLLSFFKQVNAIEQFNISCPNAWAWAW